MPRRQAEPRCSAAFRPAAPHIPAGPIDYRNTPESFKLYYKDQQRRRTGADGEFNAYRTLDNLPNEEKVLNILRYCAYIVGPIMRRHSWSIPMLCELPADSGKHGSITQIRRVGTTPRIGFKITGDRKEEYTPTVVSLQVRSPDQPGKFVAIDFVVQTLLHELAHIGSRGSHGVSFYRRNAKLLEELKKDWLQGRLEHVRRRDVPEYFAYLEEIGVCKLLLLCVL
jgi:hypothetical protein